MPRIWDNLSHLAKQPFRLAEVFAADGITPSAWDRDGTHYQDRLFYYRIINHETIRPIVQVAVRAHFDRWADSVDFQFSAPTTVRAYRKRMRRLSRGYSFRRYSIDWGIRTWV